MKDEIFFGGAVADLFPDPPHRVLVACSGGMDSVFLLHALWGCREALGLDLEVLTCDHGLRAESGADAEWMRHLAWTLGVPCHVERLEVKRQQRKGESVEMAARRLRREAYFGVAERTGADTVALGHHLDDQAETVLMRLCRGTGTAGAGGMARVREEAGVRMVRPLLGMRREEIRAKLLAWGRGWREDGTNAELEMTRNRVRHRILPALCREVNVRAVEHLAAFAEQVRGLEAWAAEETEAALSGCFVDGELHLERWRMAGVLLQERMVFRCLERWGGEPLKMTRERILELSAAWRVAETECRMYDVAGIRLLRSGERVKGQPVNCALLDVYEESALKAHNSRADPLRELVCGERMEWSPLGRILSCDAVGEVSKEQSRMTDWRGELTAFCRPGDFAVRVPQRGDRYRPLGLKGSALVSDLLGGAKVPLDLRRVWPVVTCGEEIVWVPGFRVAEDWKAGKGACLRLRMSGICSGSS